MAGEETAKLDGAGDMKGSGGQPAAAGPDRGAEGGDSKANQPAKLTYEQLEEKYKKLEGDHKQLNEKYDGKFRSERREAFGKSKAEAKAKVDGEEGKEAKPGGDGKPKAEVAAPTDPGEIARIEARGLLDEEKTYDAFFEYSKGELGVTNEEAAKVLERLSDYKTGKLEIEDELEVGKLIARGMFMQSIVDKEKKISFDEGFAEATRKFQNSPAGGGKHPEPKASQKSTLDPTGTRGKTIEVLKQLGG